MEYPIGLKYIGFKKIVQKERLLALCFVGIQRKAYLTMFTMKLTKELRFSNSGFSTNTRKIMGRF